MSELREQIEDHIVKLLEISQTWPDDSDLRNTQSRHSGDHILALIAEAMLSDEAKIAASRQMHELSMIGVWDNKVFAHEGIEAALTAAGITPGDDREGGEGE